VLSYLFDHVPWLAPLLAWSVAITVAMVVVSIPAHFFLSPFFRMVRRAAAFACLKLRRQQEQRSEARIKTLNERVDAFSNDNLLKRLQGVKQSLRAEISASLRRPVKALRKQMEARHARLQKLSTEASQLRQAIVALRPPSSSQMEIPEVGIMLSETVRFRRARIRLIVTSVLLTALIFVNTGMLSQILRELNIIPPSYIVFGVPLSYFLALLITLVESGLGFWHSTLRPHNAREESNERDDKLYYGPWLVGIMAFGVAIVEGFFYSRIAPPSRAQVVIIPIVAYEIPQTDIFFIWGFLLVMTLFGLGNTWYRAYSDAAESSSPRKLSKELGRIRSQLKKYAEEVTLALRALEQAEKESKEDSGGALIEDAVQRLRDELDRLDRQEAADVKKDETALTRTEVFQLANGAGLWLCLSLVLTLVLVDLGLQCFRVLSPDLDDWLYWALAGAQAGAFLTAGLLLASGEIVIRGEAGGRVEAPFWSRIMGIGITSLLIGIYLVVVLTVARERGIRLIWTCDFLLGAVQLAAAYKMAPLLGLMQLFFERLGVALADAGELLVRAGALTVLAIVTVMELLVRLLATPMRAIWRLR
jgi:CHASE3 domain sensor protein